MDVVSSIWKSSTWSIWKSSTVSSSIWKSSTVPSKFSKIKHSILYQVLANQAQYNSVLAYLFFVQQAISSELGVRDDWGAQPKPYTLTLNPKPHTPDPEPWTLNRPSAQSARWLRSSTSWVYCVCVCVCVCVCNRPSALSERWLRSSTSASKASSVRTTTPSSSL